MVIHADTPRKLDLDRARDICQRALKVIDKLDGALIFPEVNNNSTAQKEHNRHRGELMRDLQYIAWLARDLGVEVDAEFFRSRGYEV